MAWTIVIIALAGSLDGVDVLVDLGRLDLLGQVLVEVYRLDQDLGSVDLSVVGVVFDRLDDAKAVLGLDYP